jgi:hypothetical protein
LLVSSFALALATATGTPAAAAAISPVAASRVVAIGTRCPTLSWGEVEGAKEYELVVLRVEAEVQQSRLVFDRRLPGTVTRYALPLESCPQRAGSPERYAWAVRALTHEGNGGWSDFSLFELAPAFDVPWHTVDDGGGRTSGNTSGSGFAAVVTIGQPEPPGKLIGGGFTLRGGFWPRLADSPNLFADGFESGTVNAWSSSTF